MLSPLVLVSIGRLTDSAILDTCIAAAHRAQCDLEHVDARKISADEFHKKYRDQRPVVLTNVGKNWAAYKKWSQTQFMKRFGSETVSTRHMHQGSIDNGPWHGNETVGSIVSGQAGPQVYTFNPTHKLIKSISSDWSVPTPLRAIQRTGPIMSVGKMNSTVRFHQHLENWLAQVFGRKLWLIAPPEVDLDSDDLPCMVRRPEHASEPKHRDILLCVVQPTQAIYIPSMWWHGTYNLDNYSVGIGYLGGWASALHQASAQGDADAVKEALRNYESADIENEAEDEVAPLVAAVLRGHSTIMDLLLQAAPYETKEELQIALTQAVLEAPISGHVRMIRSLVKLRASINAPRDAADTNPLALSVQLGHVGLVSFLIKSKADTKLAASFEPLAGAPIVLKAADRGHLEVVALLLEPRYGFSVNVRDTTRERTLLQHSLDFPHVVDYLLRRRADVSLVDAEGQDAMHSSVDRQSCNEISLKLLLAHGTPVNKTDHSKQQPLHIAVRRGHQVCVEELLRHGVDVNAESAHSDGHSTPLEIAVRRGHWGVAKFLVREGATVTQAVRRLSTAAGSGAARWLDDVECKGELLSQKHHCESNEL